MTTKELASALYAELDARLGANWRKDHISFDAAVTAAGPNAQKICKDWRAQFAKRTDRKLASADRTEEEEKTDDSPVADKGPIGRHLAAERWAEERGAWDEDQDEHRGAKEGFAEDSLYHPERPFVVGAKPWSGTAFKWNPTPPRDRSAIHC